MADLILIIGLAVSSETRQCWVLLMLYKVSYSATLGANTRSNQLCWGDSEMETAKFCHIMLHSTCLGIIGELKH